MTKRVITSLLAFIIILSNISTISYANNNIDNEEIKAKSNYTLKKEKSGTRLLQDTTRNIYVLDLKIKNRKHFKDYLNKYEELNHYLQKVKEVKVGEVNKYTKAFDNAKKVYDYYKNNLYKPKENFYILILPNCNINDAFNYTSSTCSFTVLGKSYSEALDAMGHEYTHTILRSQAEFIPETNEQSSIEEGICDYMGMVIEGKKWYINNGDGNKLRDIKDPTSVYKSYTDVNRKKMKGYPDHYTNRALSKDNDKGYTNSTIVSHLLYTIQSKIKGTRSDVHLKVGKLAYRAIQKKSSHNSIEDFAQNLYEVAYSDEKKYVEAALKEVGLKPSISINAESISLNVGKSKQLSASVYPKNGQASKRIKWSSSNKTVATVNKDGKVEAKSVGKATITASIKVGDKTIKSTCTVTVSKLQRKISFTIQVPSNYTSKYDLQILDGNNNVLYTSKQVKGNIKRTFTYTINSTSDSYKRKIRVVTKGNKYTSKTFEINKDTLNKDVFATFKDKKITVTQK